MAIIPVDIREIFFTGEKVRRERELPVRIAVLVDSGAPSALIDELQAALAPATSQARIHVELVRAGEVLQTDEMADAVIALAGPGTALNDSLRQARDALIPTVAVALEPDREVVAQRLMHPINDVVADPDPADALSKLGVWLVERNDAKKLALATNFAFMRRAVADEAVKNTAIQNGLIGGVLFIPGADMPVMTANQAKMIMQIAAIYGEPLGAERLKELAAVVGGGFALRAVARSLIGLVPGFGWAVKAGIGYTGTWAMGRAAMDYFENGGSVQGMLSHVAEARDQAIEAVQRRRRTEPIEAEAVVITSDGIVPATEEVVVSGGAAVPNSESTREDLAT